MRLSYEEKLKRIKELRPIDDIFFEVLAENKLVCQEMLRTIMEDPELSVKDVIVQHDKRNLYGRSVRLDALCILSDGTRCNIEVQRADNDNHFKRVRFNASSITVKDSNTGDRFEDVLELYIVYISETDFIKEGRTIYHTDKILRETGTVIDDGLHEIYVNAAVDDGTDIADLMSCFVKKEVNNPKFPVLSSEMKQLKETEGGTDKMCSVMQDLIDMSRNEGFTLGRNEGINIGRSEGINIGRNEGRVNRENEILSSMRANGLSSELIEKILKGLPS